MSLLAGCVSDLHREAEQELRRAVVESSRRELREAERSPQRRTTLREDRTGELGIRPQFFPELEAMAGPSAHDVAAVPLGNNLLGEPVHTLRLDLERVIKTAASNNIAVQFARIAPAISQSQVVEAEAAFDWTLYGNLNQTFQDAPQVSTSFAGFSTSPSVNVQRSTTTQLGLRKNTGAGGRFTLQQDLNYAEVRTPGSSAFPNPSALLAYTFQVDQPLLRGFGSEYAKSEIRLARNAERSAIQSFRRDVMRQVTDAEKTYYQLGQVLQELAILRANLERGEKVRDQMRSREQLDAKPAAIAEAVSRVEQRRADVLRAQTAVRQLSDRLKQLMNDPEFPVGSEVLLIPSDKAVDQPIDFSLLDAVLTGIAHRPEVTQALLTIDDTSIRQILAQNARLPQLDLRLQARFSALENNTGNTFNEVFSGQFVDYLVGVVFEHPLGNRAAESLLRRRRLERMQAVLAYRNAVQQVSLEVKSALQRVELNYALIAQTRTARLAAAESLRAFMVEKVTIGGFDVLRLDSEFNKQDALAQAERQEVAALAEYNSAVADLYAAMGRTLERNNIRFVVPRAEELWNR